MISRGWRLRARCLRVCRDRADERGQVVKKHRLRQPGASAAAVRATVRHTARTPSTALVPISAPDVSTRILSYCPATIGSRATTEMRPTLFAHDIYDRSFADAVKPVVNEIANAESFRATTARCMRSTVASSRPMHRSQKWATNGRANASWPRASNTPHSTRLGSAWAIDDCPGHRTRASKSLDPGLRVVERRNRHAKHAGRNWIRPH